MRKSSTPGTPRQVLQKVKPHDPTHLNKPKQKRYQSGVGSLLYLLKHSRPELSNPIRELSKCMTMANEKAMHEMKRVIHWVLTHKYFGLKLAPIYTNKNGIIVWTLEGIADST